ncbi:MULTISPECIES: sigma-70 family RNA polymerase sigma factor [Acidobacterium]|uniref:RNA polymerase sigma factor n=1 Tax=Acidobacterium TaxID=33973 RepID=UPI0006924732|nr:MULTISPECIES: sigma-70 family RNA polymerase sigma factor [Acidobacterium]HCT62011.1 RNA polymerase subunit sigma-24 [Acidobacterium sp.]
MQREFHDVGRHAIPARFDKPFSESASTDDPPQSISTLVLAAQQGSHAAFDQLQLLYRHRIFRQIVAITGNREDAEDALQDTFLRAFVKLQSFEGRSQFYTWLNRIAINSALMKVRQRRHQAEIAMERTAGPEDEPLTFEVRDNALNPEQICDLRQRLQKTMSAIERLEPTLRSVMRTGLAEGCSIGEIAQALEITQSAAKTRLHRARRKLRNLKVIKECGPHSIGTLQTRDRNIANSCDPSAQVKADA